MDEDALPVKHGTRRHWLAEVSYLHGGGLFNHRRSELAGTFPLAGGGLLGGHSCSRQHSCVYTQPSEQPRVYNLPCKQFQTRV